MESLIISTLAFPGQPLRRSLLLAASLREFGGALADIPIWLFYPSSLGEFSAEESTIFGELGVEPRPFQVEAEVLKFPLGTKVRAAAAAEKAASGVADQVAWLDEDTLVLSPPEEFILPEGKVLGYRPVHHKLLGTSWGQEPGQFWRLIYQHCGASPEQDFRMVTHTGETIRPYFNAGSYVVRPERGLLASWWGNFHSSYQAPEFRSFYQQDALYAIFIHQAIFTGTVMAQFNPKEIQALSPLINYPLHLQGEIQPDLRISRVDDLATARYESILDQGGWQDTLPFSDELADWLSNLLDQYRDLGGGK